jgi:recombination protein RecT
MAQEIISARDQTQGQVKTIRDLLEKSKTQIGMALPRHMNADRLLRIAMTSIQRNPKLLECTPMSLIGSVITGAQIGLEPDGVRAHLVPRKIKGVMQCQFMADYKGLMDLTTRSGRARISPPVAVYEHDDFEYALGLEPVLKHVPKEEGERGKLTHVYAVARYKDGSKDFRVMTRSEVDLHRAKSPAKDDGPWVTNYKDMALKTVVRDLAKFVPSSPELSMAISLDEKAEQGLPQDIDLIPGVGFDSNGAEDGESAGNKPTGLDTLADQMKRTSEQRTNGGANGDSKPEASNPEQTGNAAQDKTQTTGGERLRGKLF